GVERVRALDLAAVDAQPVGRPQVADDPPLTAGRDVGVAAGHVPVAQDDVALAAAPDRRAVGRDDDPLAVDDQHRAAAGRGPGADVRQRLLVATGGRVDHGVAHRAGG